MSKFHELKILPDYFDDVKNGIKTFEIRKNDRGYQVGDSLILQEFQNDSYTGKELQAIVRYMTDYEQKENYVVMAIEVVSY